MATPEIDDVLRMCLYAANKNVWPVDGGLLAQSKQFVDCVGVVKQEIQRIEDAENASDN